MSGETPDGQFAKLYPGLAVAGRGACSRSSPSIVPRLGLPRQLANSRRRHLGVLYFEYKLDDTQMIRSLGHWLVYLQLIKYFLPKTAEDDWFLFLSATDAGLDRLGRQSERPDRHLALLWAMLAVWVLGQFFLQREAQRLLPCLARPMTVNVAEELS